MSMKLRKTVSNRDCIPEGIISLRWKDSYKSYSGVAKGGGHGCMPPVVAGNFFTV